MDSTRTSHRSPSPTREDDIPTCTSPNRINSLWEEVRSIIAMSSRGTLSRGRKNIGGSNRGAAESAKNSPSASVNLSLFDQSESRATPDSAFTSSNPRTISPRSTKFTKLVLNPRGIFINDTNTIVPSAFSHFRTPQPSPGETIDYTTIPGLAGANIWVSLDGRSVGDIVAEYREMRALNLCEEEFATFAKENFLRGDLRSRRVVEDRTWRSERMLQLVCPPKESAHWRIPPLFDSGSGATLGVELDWSWDIRPDCAYWLSLKGFNPKYRFQIQNCTFVRDWITCPYFTIEFKRDGESEDVAVRQVCAAGALALFNRHHLYCEARRTVSLVDDREGVRHYGLTFVGHKFVFWVLNPTCDEAGRWTGCVMTRLFGADCTDEYAVQELADWINEIHRWGLSWYGPGCERDIKSVLNAGGLRTSSVHEAVG